VIDLSKFSNVPWVNDRINFLTIHGSHAYGLNTPTSDIDVKGFVIPPKEYFLGYLNRFEQLESHEPDMVVYEIRKFFQLASDCNPNIIEILWVDESMIQRIDDFGKKVLEIRDHFLSQKARHTFSGYAIAQLKRIKTHRKWLLDPPKGKPVRTDFGLPERTVISRDMMGAIQAVLDAGGSPAQYGPNVMQAYEKERAYHNALVSWQQYENWKKTRNPARAELEAEHGYDCKHAMHLVRLMRMCREILMTGEVIVKRPDREELLAIRNGAWEYDQLLEWAERQDGELEEIAKSSIILPHSPNRKFLDEQCRELVEACNWPS